MQELGLGRRILICYRIAIEKIYLESVETSHPAMLGETGINIASQTRTFFPLILSEASHNTSFVRH
jgi:hypothetical protein